MDARSSKYFARNVRKRLSLTGKTELPQFTQEQIESILSATEIDDEPANALATQLGVPLDDLCRGCLIEEPEGFRTIFRNRWKIADHTARFLINLQALGWTDAYDDAKNVGASLRTENREELGWIWLHSSISLTVAQIVRELSEALVIFENENDAEVHVPELTSFADEIAPIINKHEIYLDDDFFRKPAEECVEDVRQQFTSFLRGVEGIPDGFHDRIETLCEPKKFRLYFLNTLRRTFVDEPRFLVLEDRSSSPADSAALEEFQWQCYGEYLDTLQHEPIFGEAFGLRSIFVELRCYLESQIDSDDEPHEDDTKTPVGTEPNPKRQRVVNLLIDELTGWLAQQREKYDVGKAVRFISGGAGSGKSSTMKMHCNRLGDALGGPAVLIPLHEFDYQGTLSESLDRYCKRHMPRLPEGLLDRDSGRLLLVFDGLDELSKAGRVGSAAAQDFVHYVRDQLRTTLPRGLELTVLFCGRPLSVSESELREDLPNTLHVLPLIFKREGENYVAIGDADEKADIVDWDQRDEWWAKFGEAKGEVKGTRIKSFPKEIDQNEKLSSLTTQPLLNYFVALDYLDGKTSSNIAELYDGMVDRVKRRTYSHAGEIEPTKSFKLSEFVEFLEVVGISAFHNAGRATTEEELKVYLTNKQRKRLQQEDKDSRRAITPGLMNVLVGFYTQAAQVGGDRAFEFSHKSFGEYFAANWIIRRMGSIHTKMAEDDEFSVPSALKLWIQTFGRCRLTMEVNDFIRATLQARANTDSKSLLDWRETILELMGRVQRHGVPVDQKPSELWIRDDESGGVTFRTLNRVAIRCEVALFAMHANICLAVHTANSDWSPETPDTPAMEPASLFASNSSLGDNDASLLNALDWFNRIGCYRERVAKESLSYLDLSGQLLLNIDLGRANLREAKLRRAKLSGANLSKADLSQADLSQADLSRADLSGAKLIRADLWAAKLIRADLSGAELSGAKLSGAKLSGADLSGANLSRADLSGANLSGADLSKAELGRAKLSKAELSGAKLKRGEVETGNSK